MAKASKKSLNAHMAQGSLLALPGKASLPPNTKSTHVPDQYLGYSLQATRFLDRLLDAQAGDIICLEVIGDVGVIKSSGEIITEEDKSTHGDNPISDRAESLWKTFSNWRAAVKSGEVDVSHAAFELYVSAHKTGDIAARFCSAQTEEEAAEAFTMARDELWGKPPNFTKKKQVAAGISAFVENVLSDSTTSIAIIRRFQLRFPGSTPLGDISKKMSSKFMSDGAVSDAVKHAMGWVREVTDCLIAAGKPARVPYDDFQKAMVAYLRQRDRAQTLASYAPTRTNEAIEDEHKSHLPKTYLRQLELIKLPYDSQLDAVRCLLSAAADRVKWSERGDVDEAGFDSFALSLQQRWRSQRDLTNEEHEHKGPEARGKILYSRCALEKVKLNGMDVPEYFAPGSFHSLADVPIIGWHPEYDKKLKEASITDNGEHTKETHHGLDE